MIELSKQKVERLLRVEEESGIWFGKVDLFVEALGAVIQFEIDLESKFDYLTDRTIQTINDVANLTEEHHDRILRFLYEDVMLLKGEADYGDPAPEPEVPPKNWWKRFFWRPNNYRFTRLEHDDERHPMFGIHTQSDIDARIKWAGVCFSNSQESPKRIAFLTCYPAWEQEHGREIAICNGVPVGIGDVQLNEYEYQKF